MYVASVSLECPWICLFGDRSMDTRGCWWRRSNCYGCTAPHRTDNLDCNGCMLRRSPPICRCVVASRVLPLNSPNIFPHYFSQKFQLLLFESNHIYPFIFYFTKNFHITQMFCPCYSKLTFMEPHRYCLTFPLYLRGNFSAFTAILVKCYYITLQFFVPDIFHFLNILLSFRKP